MNFSIFSSDKDEDVSQVVAQRQAISFVRVFLVLFFLVAATYWMMRIYFVYTGDLLPMKKAAQELISREDNCLYRNTLSSRTHHLFKIELLNAQERMPSVIVLGSSRTLLFHQRMFRSPFLNMGRASNRLKEAISILNKLAQASQPPEVLLMGVDFWWFHPKRSRHPGETANPRDINPENFGDVMQMLQRALERPSYLTDVLGKNSCNIGVDAILHERGFDRTGFKFMGHLPAATQRKGFADILARIRDKRNKFEQAEAPDKEMVDAFIAALRRLQHRGVLVVAFMPPLPPSVVQAMAESNGYAYVDRLRERLLTSDIPFVDFSQYSELFHACQFLDGIHQGDTVNAAMLIQLVKHAPQLQPYLNMAFLQWLAGFRRNALVLNALRLKQQEEDFLGLGCRKAWVEEPQN